MAEILSQSQIDDLLNNLNSGEIDIKEIENQSKEKKVKEYDFRSPKKITKETIKFLNSVFENYCRMLSSYFSSILRLPCDITVEQVEESRFHEYNNALDDYVLMGVVDVSYSDDSLSDHQLLMDVSKSMSFLMIDRLLGGSGQEGEYDRDYTDIELMLLSNLFKQIIPKIGVACENTVDIKTAFNKIETNSRFIQSINYNDTVVVIVLNSVINETNGKITMCIPLNLLDELFKKADLFSKTNKKKNVDSGFENQKEAIMGTLKSSKLNVVGVLGHAEATLSDIIKMQPGDVIILDKASNASVDINVDGEKWFEGKWGTRKNKGVIKINKIIR